MSADNAVRDVRVGNIVSSESGVLLVGSGKCGLAGLIVVIVY